MHETMGWPGPLTHRQMLVWQAWINTDLERPSRSDNYAMQIACEVRRMFSKSPPELKDFVLRFKSSSTKQGAANTSYSPDSPLSLRKQETAVAKFRWFSMMTKPIEGVPNG